MSRYRIIKWEPNPDRNDPRQDFVVVGEYRLRLVAEIVARALDVPPG